MPVSNMLFNVFNALLRLVVHMVYSGNKQTVAIPETCCISCWDAIRFFLVVSSTYIRPVT